MADPNDHHGNDEAAPDFSWTWVLGSWEDMLEYYPSTRCRRLELGNHSLNPLTVPVLSFLLQELQQFEPSDRLRIVHVGELETPVDAIEETIPLLTEFLACNQSTLEELRFGLSPQVDLWARALRMNHAWPTHLTEVGFSGVTIQGSDIEWMLRRMFSQDTLRRISFNGCAIDETLLQNILPFMKRDLESFAWNRRNHVAAVNVDHRVPPRMRTILTKPLLDMLADDDDQIRWKQLHLREQNLTEFDLTTLASIFHNNPHLQFLDLSWNDFFPAVVVADEDDFSTTNSQEGLTMFLQALSQHPQLASLKLVGCHLDNAKTTMLFEALEESRSMKELLLAENPITSTGGWVDRIPKLTHLTTLSLPNIRQLGNRQQEERLFCAVQRSLSLETFHCYYEYTPREVKLALWRNYQWRRVLQLQQQHGPIHMAVWPYLLQAIQIPKEASPLFGFLQKYAGNLTA